MWTSISKVLGIEAHNLKELLRVRNTGLETNRPNVDGG